jgi:putative flippase GtrA
MHPPHFDQPQRCLIDAVVQTNVIDVDANGRPAAILVALMTRLNRSVLTWPLTLMGPRLRLLRFIVVGCSAAAVHWAVVVGLVSLWIWHPLLANIVGWLLAFGVSFLGHHWLTFRDHGSRISAAAPRFFMVSAMGFAVNELAYALMLQISPAHYRLWLFSVLLGVAGFTYVLSRHWAFLRNEESS